MEEHTSMHISVPKRLYLRARELGISPSIVLRKCLAHRVRQIELGIKVEREERV